MRKLKSSLAFFMAAVLLFICGCQNNIAPVSTSEEEYFQKKASVYYSNDKGTYLIKKDIDISDKKGNEILSTVMEKLIEGPSDETLKSALRSGTKCLWIRENSGCAEVNLSKEFYNEENLADVIAVGAVVKSLCSVNYIDRVKIFVEDIPLTDDTGNEIGELKDSDFVFDADALDKDEENVVLYFSDTNAEHLVPEIRKITIAKGDVMEKIIVSELIEGPSDENKTATIPSGTKIISVETKDGVCFVNLSKEFVTRNMGGTTSEILAVYSIVNSLTELNGVTKVQFLIDGEKRNEYIHIMFSEPFERDISMVG